MALPSIILPPEQQLIGSMKSQLLAQSPGDSTQDLLRELIDISNKSFEKMNILADIAQLQVEEAKKLAFQLREMAIEAARGSGGSDTSAVADPEALAEEEKKGLDLPFMIFGAGGFKGFLSRFLKGIGLTAILGGLAYMLGDDLNKYVTDLTGQEDMGSLAEYMLYGSAAAPLITSMLAGTKFAGRFGGLKGLIVGAVAGLLVGLVNIFESKVEEGTGSALLGDLTAALTGALGGAAVGLMVAGPAGIIPGLLIGLAVSAIKSLYQYFTDDTNKQKIDEEFGKVEDALNQASQWMINWVRSNLIDPVRKAMGLSTIADTSDSRVQAIDEKIAAAKENLKAADEKRDEMYDQATALNREARDQPRTPEGRAERDRLHAESDRIATDANTLVRTIRRDIKALKSERGDILQTVADERNAATTEPPEILTARDFLQLGEGPMSMIRTPANPGGIQIAASQTGQAAAAMSESQATAQAAPIVIDNSQSRGGDTNITNVKKTTIAAENNNYDESIRQSMRRYMTND